MRLTDTELELLTAACADPTNLMAQELVNVVAAETAPEMVQLIALLPPEMQTDLETYVREAIDEQKRRVSPPSDEHVP